MLKQFLESDTSKNQDLKKLYSLIQKYGPITKNELIEKTQIKKTTLVRMLDELLKNTYIIESGYGESTVGRPPILYDVNSGHFLIGLHISRMKTNIVLLNLKYEIIDQETFVMTSIHTPEFVMSKVKTCIQNFMDRYQFDVEQLLGIGIGTITPLEREKGQILEPGYFLADSWHNVPIVQMVKDLFPVKVVLEKGANAGAIAEYYAADFLHANLLYCVSGGWGMDCGVIVDGKVLPDHYADAGGYGHMIVDFDGEKCSCGKYGCVIAYTSFKSILRDLNNKGLLVGTMNEEVYQSASFRELMEYFKQGNESTKDLIFRSGRYLGIGLSNLLNLFQSELVVLNGPLIYEFNPYLDQVVDHAKQNVSIRKEVSFTTGKHKENAPAIGAGILLFESYFQNELYF